jgi:hypothetical protein
MTGSVTWQGQLDVSNGLVSGSGTASFEGGGRCGGGTLYTYTGKVPVTFEGRFFGDRFSGFSINGPNRDEAFAQTNFSFPEGGQCSLDELAGYGIPAAYDAGIANSKFLSLSVGYQVPFVWEPEGSTFRQKLEVTITEEK